MWLSHQLAQPVNRLMELNIITGYCWNETDSIPLHHVKVLVSESNPIQFRLIIQCHIAIFKPVQDK
jgi:hypothetical protein